MAKKEQIYNVPNTVTLLRVVLTLVLVILYLFDYPILTLLAVFVVAAITDFLDGILARRLDQETLFGARFDILADRILWITFGLILLFGYTEQKYYNIYNFVMIFSREILSGIFLLFYLLISRNTRVIPYVRYSGKILTVLQSITIPAMILSDYISFFEFYKPLILLCGLIGLFCAIYYMVDLTVYEKIKGKKFMRVYDALNSIAPAAYQNK